MIKIFEMLFIYVFAILLHEYGHIAYFKYVKKKEVKFKWYYNNWHNFGFKVGRPMDYVCLSNKEYIEMALWGVLAGAIVIMFYALIETPFMLLYLIPYIYPGSWWDIKQIIKIKKDESFI